MRQHIPYSSPPTITSATIKSNPSNFQSSSMYTRWSHAGCSQSMVDFHSVRARLSAAKILAVVFLDLMWPAGKMQRSAV